MAKKSKKSERNTGKPFEAKVAETVRKLYPMAKVEEDIKRPAIITGGKRQIDVLLHHDGELTDFEAKDHKRNIGIDPVAAYSFKLEDEQVKNGVMVSRNPYSSSSVSTAKHLGIKLAHLVDTTDEENPLRVASTTLVIDSFVSSLGFSVYQFDPQEHINLVPDLEKTLLIDGDGNQFSVYTVFQSLWNEGVIPQDEGVHGYAISNQQVVITDGKVVTVAEFHFNYTVGMMYKIGQWTLQSAQGLYDIGEGSLHTNGRIESANLSIDEISKWPTITKEEAENVLHGIEMVVVSPLPDSLPI
ncbi:MAG TPA: hypothetical protein VN081_03995, partial [Dongiaceae bacterium]|nr:hypothetical protein [Dongiaceae bacterium]